MKKNITRLFSVLLAAVLVFGTLPVSAMGTDVADPPASTVDDTAVAASTAEPEESSAADETSDDAAQPEEQSAEEENVAVQSIDAVAGYDMNIFFLDCGRKYYSVDSIEKLIDNAKAAGFNYIQLAVGNDGLRFLLDDMSLTVNGTTYSSNDVATAIHEGNQQYDKNVKNDNGVLLNNYSPAVDELTQSQMKTIITYAQSKHMGVIPCVNTPGHMDAILYAADKLTKETCSYGGSARTIDVTNATAVAFTQALLQKYITYFANMGCQYFNMGADEYANDVYKDRNGMGFGVLQSKGQYDKYITYINSTAKMIEDAKMKPMAFNDGIYYGVEYSSNVGTIAFDTDIIVCYWSSGWGIGYAPAPASYLVSKGFKMVNTHGDYYWVIGKGQCTAETAKGFQYKQFMGTNGVSPVGSMFCVWADYPGNLEEDQVISGTADVISAFGGACPEVEAVYESPKTDPDPDPEITITPSTNADAIYVNDSFTLVASKEVLWSVDDSSVIELSAVAAQDAEGSDALQATAVTATARAAGTAVIKATDPENAENSKELALTVTAAGETTKEINLVVGGKETETINDRITGSYQTENPDVAIVEVGEPKEIPGNTTYQSTTLGTGELYVDTSSDAKTPSAQLTLENAGSGQYYIKRADGTYIYPYASYSWFSRRWTYTCGEEKKAVNISENSDHSVMISCDYVYGNRKTTAFLTLTDGEFGASDDDSSLYLYKKVSGDKTYTTDVTFTGVAEGDTTVTIGNVKYNIHVAAENLDGVTDRNIGLWITNKHVTGTGLNADSVDISAQMQNIASANGVEFASLVPATGTAKIGDKEQPMTFWKGVWLSSSDKQTTDTGCDKTLVGTTISRIRYYGGQWSYLHGEEWNPIGSEDQIVAYYMQRTDVTEEVTTNVVDWGEEPGYNLSYPIYDANGYYVFVDFAVKYATDDNLRKPNSFPNTNTVAYHCDPGDTTSVSGTGQYNNGVQYYQRRIGSIWAEPSDNYEVYMITLTPTEDSIRSTLNKKASSYSPTNTYSYNGTEKVVWVDKAENIPDRLEGKLADGITYGGEPIVNSLTVYQQHGMLVTYYVRAKPNDDSLTVRYADNKTKEVFHEVTINVKENTTFKSNIDLNKTTPNGYLDNGDVENTLGTTEYVTASLAGVTTIPNQYRYAAYTAVRVEKSADLKTVTIYYDFDNTASFVIDFGTPVEIPLIDIAPTATAITKDQVEITGQTHGSAEVVESDGAVTIKFKPDNRFTSSEQGETLTVTINDGTIKSSYIAYIYPASNVLYEEGFLTQDTDNRWEKVDAVDTAMPDGNQQTQKVDDNDTTYSVFGYDESYDKSIGANGVWEVTGLTTSSFVGPLTTEFYGNTFDLIGNCGPKTGRVFLMITKNEEDAKTKLIDIDTRYSGGDIAQVPLAHKVLDEQDATYTVAIYACGLAATSASENARMMAISEMSIEPEEDEILAQILAVNGLSLDDVEYTSTSVEDTLNETAAAVDLYNAKVATDGTGANSSGHQAGTQVEIDGFRVYRSTATSGENETPTVADNYPEAEQNVNYWNILDVIKGSITAYTEYENEHTVSVQQYEKDGGPQNEIYLAKGQGVAFKLTDSDIKSVQVSLRAVNKSAKYNDGAAIESNTEMYYSVDAVDGIFTITNTGDELLAIGNVKLPSSVTDAMILPANQISNADLATAIQLAIHGAEEPEVFTPDTFTAKTTATKVIRNKVVTLKVTVSSDVAYVTINGVKYTRTGFQSAFNKNRTILVVNTVPKNETKTYEIIAYNADGIASETKTVTG